MSDKKKNKKWRKKLDKMSKASPYLTGAGAAVGGYFLGAPAGAAIGAAGAFGGKYMAEAGARGKGKDAKAAGARAMRKGLMFGIGGGVAGAGVAGIQAYMNTGKANVGVGTFMGGRSDFLGMSSGTTGFLDSALPTMQKAFGFEPRQSHDMKSLAKKAAALAGKKGGMGDLMGGFLTGDKAKGEQDNESSAPAGGGMGPMGRMSNEDEPTSGGNGGLIAAGLLGLLFFMG